MEKSLERPLLSRFLFDDPGKGEKIFFLMLVHDKYALPVFPPLTSLITMSSPTKFLKVKRFIIQ